MSTEVNREEEWIVVPTFDGTNLNIWIVEMEEIMVRFDVPSIQKVNFAHVYVEGIAKDWVRFNYDQICLMDWSQFVDAIRAEFVAETVQVTASLDDDKVGKTLKAAAGQEECNSNCVEFAIVKCIVADVGDPAPTEGYGEEEDEQTMEFSIFNKVQDSSSSAHILVRLDYRAPTTVRHVAIVEELKHVVTRSRGLLVERMSLSDLGVVRVDYSGPNGWVAWDDLNPLLRKKTCQPLQMGFKKPMVLQYYTTYKSQQTILLRYGHQGHAQILFDRRFKRDIKSWNLSIRIVSPLCVSGTLRGNVLQLPCPFHEVCKTNLVTVRGWIHHTEFTKEASWTKVDETAVTVLHIAKLTTVRHNCNWSFMLGHCSFPGLSGWLSHAMVFLHFTLKLCELSRYTHVAMLLDDGCTKYSIFVISDIQAASVNSVLVRGFAAIGNLYAIVCKFDDYWERVDVPIAWHDIILCMFWDIYCNVRLQNLDGAPFYNEAHSAALPEIVTASPHDLQQKTTCSGGETEVGSGPLSLVSLSINVEKQSSLNALVFTLAYVNSSLGFNGALNLDMSELQLISQCGYLRYIPFPQEYEPLFISLFLSKHRLAARVCICYFDPGIHKMPRRFTRICLFSYIMMQPTSWQLQVFLAARINKLLVLSIRTEIFSLGWLRLLLSLFKRTLICADREIVLVQAQIVFVLEYNLICYVVLRGCQLCAHYQVSTVPIGKGNSTGSLVVDSLAETSLSHHSLMEISLGYNNPSIFSWRLTSFEALVGMVPYLGAFIVQHSELVLYIISVLNRLTFSFSMCFDPGITCQKCWSYGQNCQHTASRKQVLVMQFSDDYRSVGNSSAVLMEPDENLYFIPEMVSMAERITSDITGCLKIIWRQCDLSCSWATMGFEPGVKFFQFTHAIITSLHVDRWCLLDEFDVRMTQLPNPGPEDNSVWSNRSLCLCFQLGNLVYYKDYNHEIVCIIMRITAEYTGVMTASIMHQSTNSSKREECSVRANVARHNSPLGRSNLILKQMSFFRNDDVESQALDYLSLNEFFSKWFFMTQLRPANSVANRIYITSSGDYYNPCVYV